jgi:nucleotide-binding universal stress UspA family protein
MEEPAMRQPMQRIICATDFSPASQSALSYAMALARELGAQLMVCHVVDLPAYAAYGEALVGHVEARLAETTLVQQRLAEFVGSGAPPWEPLTADGNPAEEIARLADSQRADLLITGSRGMGGLKRLLLGSVTARLMQIAHVPLLVVRRRDAPAPEGGGSVRLRRILVGCDFSVDAERALALGLDLAQEFQAELHLVHVIEPSFYLELSKTASELAGELYGEVRLRLEAKLSQMVPEEARLWCTPQTALLSGRADEELCRYAAEREIDLMVLGTRGLGLVEKLLIGSTTDRVARRALCPVLSVPAAARSAG